MAAYTIVTGNVIMVQAFGKLYGQRIMNQFFYEYIDLPVIDNGPAGVLGLLSKFQTDVWTAWKLLVTDSYTLDYLQGTKVYQNRQAYEYRNVGETGSITADVALPPANSFTFSRVGELPGRGKQSALHIAGMGTEDTAGGEWTAAAIERGEAFALAVGATIVGVDTVTPTWKPTNFSFKYQLVRNSIRFVIPDQEVRTVSRRVVRQGI